jgi:hypothetical protein
MHRKKPPLLIAVSLSITAFALVATGQGTALLRDLWIHPRGEAFDPAKHYKAPDGEIHFHAENDLGRGLEAIVVHGGSDPRVTADIGGDLWRFVERNRGSLQPVVLYDSNGDGRVDRTVRGSISERGAVFTDARIGTIDWRNGHWQMGIRYEAGPDGAAAYDRRYLASVDSKDARVRYPRVDDLPAVRAGPGAGLVIFKHRAGAEFDLTRMARQPDHYLADFDELTPEKDADPWTVKEKKKHKGKLRTRLDEENLLLVRTRGDATLAVEWGDMPLEEFLQERLAVAPDADGCLSTMESRVVGDDGEHAPVPHRILYCPHASMALFDAPPGYQIGLSAGQGETELERTEATTSIFDNIRLYGRQVYERSPRKRSTGTVSGNLRASFQDSGRDVVDMGRHLVTGTERRNIHTGQIERRTSLLAAAPMLLYGLVRLDPVQGGVDFIEGIQSGVQIGADAVSAVDNAVINPLLQVTVGLASPDAADDAGHWTGALTQAWAKNLPGSERSMDALSPVSLWNHNRAFAPTAYTRTDTQLNIDRIFTIANIFGIYGLTSGGGGGNGNGGASEAAPPAAPSPPPVPAFRPGC